jgi:predicted nucleic acid-binding protein
VLYLDSSVIVAYYLDETYSRQAQELYRRNAGLVLGELAEVEVFSVLARLVRVGSLGIDAAGLAGATFDEHVDAGLYARLSLRAEHYRWAKDAIARFDLTLKAPDALHLAAARIGGHRLITADRQLARNAESLAIPVEMIEP